MVYNVVAFAADRNGAIRPYHSEGVTGEVCVVKQAFFVGHFVYLTKIVNLSTINTMLKLSSRTRYGIRALMELACNRNAVSLPISSISSRQDIPRPYLEQILHSLNRAGIVESTRGPAGGYRLKKAPSAITLADIIEVLEPARSALFCLGESDKGLCRKPHDCFSHFLCSEIDSHFKKTLNKVTLSHIARQWQRKG